MTRPELYRFIDRKREELGLYDLPVYTPELVRERYPDILLREEDFFTRKVGGALYLGPRSMLVLNLRRSEVERNFDCAHELLHYWSGIGHYALTPDRMMITPQDPYIEWVANEGAAELLIPFRRVLPLFYHERLWQYTEIARRERLRILAEGFIVTPAQMENRYRSLHRELAQYAQNLSCCGIVPVARGR